MLEISHREYGSAHTVRPNADRKTTTDHSENDFLIQMFSTESDPIYNSYTTVPACRW